MMARLLVLATFLAQAGQSIKSVTSWSNSASSMRFAHQIACLLKLGHQPETAEQLHHGYQANKQLRAQGTFVAGSVQGSWEPLDEDASPLACLNGLIPFDLLLMAAIWCGSSPLSCPYATRSLI